LPKERVKLGTLIPDIGRRYGGVELDITRDQSTRDPTMFGFADGVICSMPIAEFIRLQTHKLE
jgi:hypothetical protein